MKKILLSISMLALAYTASANVPFIKSDPKIEAQVEHTVLVVGTKEVGHQFHHLTYLFLQGEFLQGLFYLSLNLRVSSSWVTVIP